MKRNNTITVPVAPAVLPAAPTSVSAAPATVPAYAPIMTEKVDVAAAQNTGFDVTEMDVTAKTRMLGYVRISTREQNEDSQRQVPRKGDFQLDLCR